MLLPIFHSPGDRMTFTYKTPRKNPRATEFISPLANEHMKTFVVRDDRGRVYELYEALANTADGEDCLCTIYEYFDGEVVPLSTLERPAKWNGDWDLILEGRKVNGDPGYGE